jgi:ethanolamine utilization protein EutN
MPITERPPQGLNIRLPAWKDTMRIAEVIGTVTLSRIHPLLEKRRWIVAVPFSLKALERNLPPDGEDVVALDELGAGQGQRVGISEGVEAVMPFFPERKPLDAYCAAILDQVTVDGQP